MNNGEALEELKRKLKQIATNDTAMKYGLDKDVKVALEGLIGEKIEVPTIEEVSNKQKKDCPGWIFKKHDYDRWQMPEKGEIWSTSVFNKSGVIGFWTKQQRICRNCGYTQTKIDKVMG